MTRDTRVAIAARAMHSSSAIATINRFERRARAFDEVKLHQLLHEATPLELEAIDEMEANLIQPGEFEFMYSLDARFNTTLTRRLRAEDQNYLAMARCLFTDALIAAGGGELDAAFMSAGASVKKMDFVINKRKRNAEYRDYHNIPEYPQIWADLRMLLEDMQRALAMLQRAHKAVSS